MLATASNNLRGAPTTTVAELQDVLADRARGYHDLTVRAGQLRYDGDLGLLEVQATANTACALSRSINWQPSSASLAATCRSRRGNFAPRTSTSG